MAGIATIVAPLLGKVIDGVFGKRMAKSDLDKLKQEAENLVHNQEFTKEMQHVENNMKRDLAQVEVNKIESASDDKFKSWWRPAVGWVCVSGLFFQFLLRPLMNWVLLLQGVPHALPGLEIGTLMVLLTGMLGIGATRSFDKRTLALDDDDQH